MTSGYSISLIRDPARGASQLYLRVVWISAFKQFLLTYYARPSLKREGGCTKDQYQFQPCSRYQLSSLRGMANTLRMRVTISPGYGSHGQELVCVLQCWTWYCTQGTQGFFSWIYPPLRLSGRKALRMMKLSNYNKVSYLEIKKLGWALQQRNCPVSTQVGNQGQGSRTRLRYLCDLWSLASILHRQLKLRSVGFEVRKFWCFIWVLLEV